MRAKRLVLALPLLLIATGCSGPPEPEASETVSPSSTSRPSASSFPSSTATSEPKQLSAEASCDKLVGSKDAIALRVADFTVDLYLDDPWTIEHVDAASELLSDGYRMRKELNDEQQEALDAVLEETDSFKASTQGRGSDYELPANEILLTVAGVGNDCYEGAELERFDEDFLSILRRLPGNEDAVLGEDSEETTSEAPSSPADSPEPEVNEESSASSDEGDDATPAPEPAETPSAAAQTPTSGSVPAEYSSAHDSAYFYATEMNMSKKHVYDQLVSEYGDQFTPAAAQYAIDSLTSIDWKANALASAEFYQSELSLSPAAIYDQLVSEYGDRFTPAEAQYAIDNLSR